MTVTELLAFRRRVLVAIGHRIAARRALIRERAEMRRRCKRVRRLVIPEAPKC